MAAVLFLAALAWRIEPGAPQWLVFFTLCLLFAGMLSSPMRLEVGRQGILVSPGEIPFLLALFYLSPFWVILARVVAGVAVNGYRWATGRSAVLKAAFNVVHISFAFAVTALLIHAIGLGAANEVATWSSLLLAVLVSHVTNILCLMVIITVTQGRKGLDSLLQGVPSMTAIAGINAILGLLVLLAIDSTSWAILPLSVLVVLVFAVYRGYSNLVQRRRALADLNDFTQSVAQAVQSNRLIDIMTHRLRDMLSAEAATVWVPKDRRFPEVLLTAYAETEGLLDTTPVPRELRAEVLESGKPLLVAPGHGSPQHRELLASQGVKDAVLVPLRSGNVTYGCLAAANRQGGDLARFGRDELNLLETLTAHAGVAVENSRLVDRLRFDAYHDALTELPNRRRTLTILEESISITVPDEAVALLLFDVDAMRDVNDSVGHAAGDKLIVEVGRRLREAAPESAHVGRVDGDEFAVVLRLPDESAAVELAGQIRTALQAPFALGNINIDIDSAVGIALHPDSGNEAGTLLQRADVATQTAKNVTSGVQVYNSGLESGSVRRLGLASDLRRAFEAGDELHVQYQPKLSLRQRTVVGVECLARWRHPSHGEVAPEDFVPVAEHTGLLGRLTEFVLRDGLSRMREWDRAGHDLGIAVNLSPRTLTDSDFAETVAGLLEEYEVPPDKLTLEITEEGMVGAGGRTPQTMRRLRELGVRLAVDDFGTGYSSLSYLRSLPAQEIKIDRSFVQGMAVDEGDLAIVSAVVDLARHFNMSVVAEGVESEMTLSLLTEIGCDVAQGFYFSRPLPPDRFAAWLTAQTAASSSNRPSSSRLRAM